MTPEEFSNEFDILYNNIMSNVAPGLNEYEKSVFLTKAQEEIILELYNGNSTSFERTENVRRYLSPLNNTVLIQKEDKSIHLGLSETSQFYVLPEDLWFITYESVNFDDSKIKCNSKNIAVIPTTQDEYHRIKDNPFRGPNDKKVLRLDHKDNMIELVSKYNIESYFVKYLSKPTPIILCDLDDNLSIRGISTLSECKLNPILHRVILERAVELARVAYKS